MSEDIKKGISYTAYGFAFTLINLNLKINGLTINFMPDWGGWIFFLAAIGCLSKYTGNRKYLRYIAIGMIFLTAVQWVLAIMKPELNLWLLSTIDNLLSTVFAFIYFDCLRQCAEDYNSRYTDHINILRWLNVSIYIIGAVISVFARTMEVSSTTAIVLAVYAASAIVAAAWTFIVLWLMRKEFNQM